jgi:hypothetical protein
VSDLTLTNPRGLWLLTLAIPLVLLYVLKIRRRRVTVGSTWLWAAAERDLLAKSPFKRLVPELALLLQLLVLALAALALARPSRLAREDFRGYVAIVVDVSASMNTRDASGVTQLERSKAAARELCEGLEPGTQVMVVEAGSKPRIASPLERERTRILAALDAISAEEVVGDLDPAIALSIDRLKEYDDARVVVFTDGFLVQPPTSTGSTLPVEFVIGGEPTNNVGVVRTEARRYREDGADKVEIFVLISNFGREERETYVTVSVAGSSESLDSRRLLLAAGERTPVGLSFSVTPDLEGKALVVDVSPHDALEVDDRAYAKVPPSEDLAVWLLSREKEEWVTRAFGSDPNVTIVEGTPEAANVPSDALVIVSGACPPESVGGADLLVLAPPPGPCLGLTVEPPIDEPVVTSWETSDPRLRFVSLDRLHVTKATPLVSPSRQGALVRANDHALVRDASTPGRTITVVGFDVGESDWPLKASWVLFARNVTEQARRHRSLGAASSTAPGEPLRVAVPPGTESVKVEGPGGAPIEASVRAGLAIAPSTSRTGIYRIDYEGRVAGSLLVPVNLASERESDLGTLTPLPQSENVSSRRAEEAPRSHLSFGWILAGVALILLLLEVYVGTRRDRRLARRARVAEGTS